MPDKFFSYLIFTTVGLFFLALLSYLIQPKYETSIKQGGEVFEDVKNKLDDIKEDEAVLTVIARSSDGEEASYPVLVKRSAG